MLPHTIQNLTHGYTWRPVAIGKSSARTWRLERAGAPALFLKAAALEADVLLDGGQSLLEERRVLEWLRSRLPAPQVVSYAEAGGQAYLLTTALPGIDAASLDGALPPQEVVALLGKALRAVHSLPTDSCPFDRSLAWGVAAAGDNVARGLVDKTDFDPERLGRTAEEVLAEVLDTLPSQEYVVFTHGDYCLPNVIINGRALSGFVDWGRAGLGDPYRDLALAVRSIRHNLGPGYEAAFFAAYGLTNPDWRKIEFYILLDELF